MNNLGPTCERCGMSEHGARRFRALKFKRTPCSKCPPIVVEILSAA